MRCVRVEWEGPFPIEKTRQMNGRGLYQICGHHFIYGSGILLYIGQTAKQTFGKRVTQQYADWKPGTPWDQESDDEVFVRVGRLDYSGEDFEDVLDAVEAFEIFCHSPPYNGSSISTYSRQNLIVVNEGKKGDLCERLSTAEITHLGRGVVEDYSLVKKKYFLNVYEFDYNPNSVVQSDVFEVIGKRHQIVQAARNKALNNVRREDLRKLFEKERWKGSTVGKYPGTFRGHQDGKGYWAGLVIMEAPEDADITF